MHRNREKQGCQYHGWIWTVAIVEEWPLGTFFWSRNSADPVVCGFLKSDPLHPYLRYRSLLAKIRVGAGRWPSSNNGHWERFSGGEGLRFLGFTVFINKFLIEVADAIFDPIY